VAGFSYSLEAEIPVYPENEISLALYIKEPYNHLIIKIHEPKIKNVTSLSLDEIYMCRRVF
jgi:hypothetical protein